MSAELFKFMTASRHRARAVPRLGAGIYPDLLTGKVHVLFDNLPGSIEIFVKTGKLRALGVTTAKRSPRCPTCRRSARPCRATRPACSTASPGRRASPPEIVEILNKAFNAALADPKMQKRLADLGGEPMPMTPAQFGKLVADETEKWGKVIRAAGIKAE